MNPNQLSTSGQEAFGARRPKNELVAAEALKRMAEDSRGIANGKAALELTITNAAAAVVREHGGQVVMQYNVDGMPVQAEPPHYYEYHGQVAPQERPGTIQSGQELQRRAVPVERPQPPVTPPPMNPELENEARLTQIRQQLDSLYGKAA